jgi:hypothetical protein
MSKRATLDLGDEKQRRVPVYEYSDGEREVPVPFDRLKRYDEVEQLPSFATVVHSGYRFEAELIDDVEDSAYVFDVEHY